MIRMVYFFFSLLFIVQSTIAETKTSFSKDKKYQIEETLIYEKKVGGKMVGRRDSPDGQEVAIIVEKKGLEAVWSEKFGLSEYYKTIYRIYFSPDNERLAIVAEDKNNRFNVIVDAKFIGQYDYIIGAEILFTDNSQHFVFIEKKLPIDGSEVDSLGNLVVILDGQSHQQYSSLLSLDPDAPAGVLFLDSSRVIYFARQDDRYFMVIDGIAGEEFERTGFGPAVSDDFKHIAYGGMRDSVWYVVVDSSMYGPYPYIKHLTFPPGSSEPAYVVEWADSSRIFLNHQALPTDQKWVLAPVFKASGELWANWASDGERVSVHYENISDSVKNLDYYSVSSPWISNCGNHLVYEVIFDEGRTEKGFVVDGQLLTRSDCAGNYKIKFSNDGKRYATFCFCESPVQVTVTVDGKYGPYRGKWVDPVVFSDDGKHWATRQITRKGVTLWVDGLRKNVKSGCGEVHYSPDGKHLAYTILGRNKHKERLYINETEFKSYTEISGDELKFSPDGSLTFFARDKDKKLYRVKITPL